jgi:PASTA domain
VRRIPRALAAASIAILAAVAGATPAVAGAAVAGPAGVEPKPSTSLPQQGPVPDGFASWDELDAVQSRLHAAAERILAAGGAGTASLVVGLDKRELRVYWPGTVPAPVRQLAGGLDVPVVFLPARFTHGELVKEARRLAAEERVIEAAPKADGSGLAVTVDQASQADRTRLAAATPVPLTITAGTRPQQMYDRQADVAPFWGGSRYNTRVGGCTNGFAIQPPSTANIVMLSAGHCGNDGDAANVPGRGTPTGTIAVKSGCRDTLLIYYPAGVADSVYTGAYNASTSAVIRGATFDVPGEYVSTSGASSGEHGSVLVQAVDVFTAVAGNPCATVGPLTRAGSIIGSCVVAPGDSGGPVFTRTDANAIGRGTITAGNSGSATCPGQVPVGANTVWYAPLVRPAGDPQIGSLAFYNAGIMCPGCGPTPVAVPNLRGLSESAALDALGSAGLRQGQVTNVLDHTCNDIGHVASQSPSPGTLVNPGTTVNYSVYRKPPPPFVCP